MLTSKPAQHQQTPTTAATPSKSLPASWLCPPPKPMVPALRRTGPAARGDSVGCEPLWSVQNQRWSICTGGEVDASNFGTWQHLLFTATARVATPGCHLPTFDSVGDRVIGADRAEPWRHTTNGSDRKAADPTIKQCRA